MYVCSAVGGQELGIWGRVFSGGYVGDEQGSLESNVWGARMHYA